jgi:hypothetical protein
MYVSPIRVELASTLSAGKSKSYDCVPIYPAYEEVHDQTQFSVAQVMIIQILHCTALHCTALHCTAGQLR